MRNCTECKDNNPFSLTEGACIEYVSRIIRRHFEKHAPQFLNPECEVTPLVESFQVELLKEMERTRRGETQ